MKGSSSERAVCAALHGIASASGAAPTPPDLSRDDRPDCHRNGEDEERKQRNDDGEMHAAITEQDAGSRLAPRAA